MKYRAWNRKHKIFYYSHNKENENLSDYQRIEIFFQILHEYKHEFDLPDQYTRVKDKKGKEIYEGDILHILENGRWGGEYYGEVKFFPQYGLYGIDSYEVKEISHHPEVGTLFTRGFYTRTYGNIITIAEINNSNKYSDFKFEIVGNFHENPNLMI